MYFYYKGRPLLRWLGDVGLPSTDRGGGSVTSNKRHTRIYTPTCGMDVYEWGCLCSLVFINKDETVFFPPKAQEEAVVFLFIKCFDQLLVDSPFLKIEFLHKSLFEM